MVETVCAVAVRDAFENYIMTRFRVVAVLVLVLVVWPAMLRP